MAGQGTGTSFADFGPGVINGIMSSIGSVRDLGNFVTVSHGVDQTFRPMSRNILPRVLRNELGPVYQDARFLFLLSLRDHPDVAGLWQQADNLAGIYKDLADRHSVASNAVDMTPEALTQMCRVLHNINFLADTYIAALQRRLDSEGAASGPAAAAPSDVERKRILRALYRRQMICYAWTPSETDPERASSQSSVLSLLNMLQPWELQQIDHVDMFITWLCLALCIAGRQVDLSIAQDEFAGLFTRVDNLAQFLQTHTELAQLALQQPFSMHEITKAAGSAYEGFASQNALRCLTAEWQSRCRREDPLSGPAGPAVRFGGDAVDLPPFAWVDGVAETHATLFGDGLFAETGPGAAASRDPQQRAANRFFARVWRDVGLAMWDAERARSIMLIARYRFYARGWMLAED